MFIDIHHHLVYGVDDGAKTMEAMQQMIQQAWADGIRYLITTPHATPGHEQFPLADYYSHLKQARKWCQEQGIALNLYEGSEILYTQVTPRILRERQVPTLANSRFVLLEFLPNNTFEQLSEAARNVRSVGFIPVFAHIERYPCLKKPEQLEELRDSYGVRMQINARTMIRKNGFFEDRRIHRFFDADLVDYISTDSHDMPHRHSCMTECYERLKTLYGKSRADALTYDNALEIFNA